MVSRQYFQSVFGYHFWANSRILNKASLIQPEEFKEDLGVSHGSLHATLFHMLRAEEIWYQLIERGELKSAPLVPADVDSLTAIKAKWMEIEKKYLTFLDRAADDDFEATVQVKDQNDVVTPYQRWRMLQHVLYHGAQHRAEAALILTHLGHSTGDLDFIFY
ncbi:MAG: DinB family protein [Chloroflexota bacterium]